jgi:hypothetical protein
MRTEVALELTQNVAQLVELTATFQAKYGRHYTLKPGSPAEAWALYNQIFNQQATIAQMLDTRALQMPQEGYDKWWERQDAMDLSIAKTLIQHSSHLIATVAYFNAEAHETDWSYAVYCAESAVAGLLHPSAIQVALSSLQVKSERYAG